MAYPTKESLPTRRRSLAWLLAGLGALPLLTLAMVGFLTWRGASDLTESARDRLKASARVIAVEAKGIVVSTRARLDRYLSGRPVASLITGPAPVSSRDELQGLFGFVLVFDADGHVKAESAGTSQDGIAERDYFKALKAGADWAVSGLIEQSIFGEPVFAVARRLAVNETFAGAAVMYVPADILASSRSSLDLGGHGAFALYRSDGVLVTRYPVGARVPLRLDASSLRMTDKGALPVIETEEDGSPRVTALASVNDPFLVAAASLPQQPIRDAAVTRTTTTLFAVGPVAIVLLLVCGLMARALIRQERHLVALDDAARLNETLLQEIHHRLKNNLQMVIAMVRLQPGDETDKQVLASRIQAMTAVHQLMYETNAFATLDARAYIERLLDGLSPSAGHAVTIEKNIEPIQLSADQVQPIGLIINEAVTNALKHAFPAGRIGTIRVELALAGKVVELVIADNGVGSELTAESRMGSKLMRNLARQLGGELKTSSANGTRVVVQFPV